MGVAPAAAATELVVSGKGWGHGVGMSQWGAYGYAQHGWGWERILAHYYSGTQVAAAPLSRGVVTVWRESHGGWTVVARPQTDPSGRFSVPLRLRPGGYRITVAGDGRYAAATAGVRVTRRLLALLSD
jgi:stage II sporulation protein D